MNKTIKGATLIIALAVSVVTAQSSRHLPQSVSKSQVVSSHTQSQSVQQEIVNTPTKQNIIPVANQAAKEKATVKKTEYLTITHVVPSSALKSVAEQRLFKSRIATAKKAEQFFRKKGVTSDKAIIAILVNAWHECKWDHTDKSGSCIGFFQLNRSGGMGRGYTVKQLQDLNTNMSIMAASRDFKAWVQWVNKNPNVTAGEMSYRFASKVERCASQHRAPRRGTADRWFKALKKADNDKAKSKNIT